MERQKTLRLLANPMLPVANPNGYEGCLRALALLEDFPSPVRVRLEDTGTITLTWRSASRLVEAHFERRGRLVVGAYQAGDGPGPEPDGNIHLTLKNSLAWCYGPQRAADY